MTITNLQDKVAHLNKVAEILLNLNNSDPENRRLARYDYVKMNLTAAINFEQVEQEISRSQQSLKDLIDKYEFKVRRLEKFVKNISSIYDYPFGGKTYTNNYQPDFE